MELKTYYLTADTRRKLHLSTVANYARAKIVGTMPLRFSENAPRENA
jgi:hypothetical protein